MTKFISPDILKTSTKDYRYFSLKEISKKLNKNLSSLPFSLKILLENLARNFNDKEISEKHLLAIFESIKDKEQRIEISFSPARVLMQDFTGVPAVVDLAAMRDACSKRNKDPKKINPLVPVDLVIDHSVQVDYFGSKDSLLKNVELEFQRNIERYKFLKWAQQSFNNFRVVPPGTGICHQVNLENLAKVVWQDDSKIPLAYPDTVVGTDSHTTMINGLSVLGWGVGGIEAEAAMLGQPISMLIPEVIGFKLTGKQSEGTTATDLVLTITNILRKKSVVGKFVEFFGPALENITLADRATIANMAPEYGATCGIFPIDKETIKYLELTARTSENIELVEYYAKAQELFIEDHQKYSPDFSDLLELDISTIKPTLAGPKRPQDKVNLVELQGSFLNFAKELKIEDKLLLKKYQAKDNGCSLSNGDIVLAAITSCTNTSNPYVMVTAGLVAKKAIEKSLKVKPYIKTSLAPGSQVVSSYLENSGLQKYLDELGFNIVGYGCTTCIGNSGSLNPEVEDLIKENNLAVSSILSGNRNFEGRIHPLIKANYLASPPLVVAFAIAGTVMIDLETQPLGVDESGKQVFLRDIWPSQNEINDIVNKHINRQLFNVKYANLFDGGQEWKNVDIKPSETYSWDKNSSYIRLPNYFSEIRNKNNEESNFNIKEAKILAIFGDSITTDHISPAGNISSNSPAAAYLNSKNVKVADFNSYGARRGNHEVMVRGTFANTRIKNEILLNQDGIIAKEGGYTKIANSEEIISIYEASEYYISRETPLVVFAGKEYGTGSSRDWAAKGTVLLGVKAVIAESFERIHRSNLIGMGVLPLTFAEGQNRKNLNLSGKETIDIVGLDKNIITKQDVECIITYQDGKKATVHLRCNIDTANEVSYYKNGGILQFVLDMICSI